MFKMTIEVLISQSFKNQQIIIENKFYLSGYKRSKRQSHHFCLFAPGSEIALPFAVCKEISMLPSG